MRAWLRARWTDSLYRNGYALVASSVLTSVVGLAYWVVAARTFSPTIVGLNAALIAAMTLLVAIAQLNLKSALNRFLPRAGQASAKFVVGAYLIALAATVFVSSIFLAGIDLWTPRLDFLHDRPELIVWFVLATMAWTLFVLQDSVLAGIRQAHWVPVENLVFSVSKLVLLIVLAGAFPVFGVFVSWTLPAMALVFPVSLLLFRRLLPRHLRQTHGQAQPVRNWGLARYAVADYVAYVIWSGTIAGLPLIVLSLLGPDANAYFYVSWLIAYSLYLISSSMGMSMLAEASLEPAEIQAHWRRTVVESARLVVPGALVVAVGAPAILGAMGGSYSAEGVTLLRLLALSAIPFVIVDAHVTAARAENHMRVVVGTYVALCGIVLGLGVPLMSEIGVVGAGVAWLVAQSTVAVAILIQRFEPALRHAWKGGPIALLSPAANRLRQLRSGGSSRRAGEAVLSSLRSRRPSTSEWRLRRNLNGHNDVTISEVGPADQGVAVLKLARREQADRSLENEERMLRGLWRDKRLGEWRGLLPVVLASGTVSDRRYLAETCVDGETADLMLRRGAEPKRVIAATAASIAPLYEATRSEAVVDEPLLKELVDRPIDELRPVTHRSRVRDADRALDRLRDEIRERLAGRTVVTSRVHGDLCPANVMMRPDGAEVTGLVDWERAQSRGLPDLDLLHLEMTTRMSVRGEELGTVVREMLAEDGRRDRTQVLLVWLHHVAGNVAKARRYSRSRLWVRRNVDPILATAADGAALPVARPVPAVGAVPWAWVAPMAALAVALGLWIFSLGRIDPREMTDLGLLSVLPATFYAALALLTVSFFALLRGLDRQSLRGRIPLVSAHVVALIAFLHATPAIVYGTLRYSWAWKHVGIVDYISRHGSVSPDINYLSVYHNWPGFFSLNSLFADLGGITDTIELAIWAPFLFNLLNFCALLFVFSSLTSDRRVVWLGSWLFFITNWVGQDYFSPQAFTFFLYLVVLGVVLRWLGPSDAQTREARRTRALATGFVVLMLVVIASSHALTSMMATFALAALVLAGVCAVRSLPLIAAAIVAFWTLVFAHEAIINLGTSMLETVRLPWTQTESNLIQFGQLSEGQHVVAMVSRALTSAVGALAIVGTVLQLRARRLDRTVLLLAVTPLLLFAGGSYDGEVLFRIYLFSLPFLCFLGAQALVSWQKSARSWGPAIGSTAVGAVFLGAFLFAYYGKEHQNYFTPEEVTASKYIYTHAPEGAVLIDGTTNYPRQFQDYERFNYLTIAEEPKESVDRVLADPVRVLDDWMTDDDFNGGFLIITRSQKADVSDLGMLPKASLGRITHALLHSPRFRVVFRNRDAIIFAPRTPRGGLAL